MAYWPASLPVERVGADGNAIVVVRNRPALSAAVMRLERPQPDLDDIVSEILECFPGLPVVMAANGIERDRLVQRCGAQYVPKEDWPRGLGPFVEQAVTAKKPRTGRVERALSAFGSECGLTPREIDVLRLAIGGLTRSLTASELGIAENTVKYHTKRALVKAGCERMAEVTRLVLLRAVELT